MLKGHVPSFMFGLEANLLVQSAHISFFELKNQASAFWTVIKKGIVSITFSYGPFILIAVLFSGFSGFTPPNVDCPHGGTAQFCSGRGMRFEWRWKQK